MVKHKKELSGLPLPDSPTKIYFRRRLLAWYRLNGRDLPWRKTNNPYHILVSEIMLQQTQVDRVLPKYSEWLKKFPTFKKLAAARKTQVLKTWRPLGYNIRPIRLQKIAKQVVKEHKGNLPADTKTLRSFKGLGAYTVGAVQCFRFNKRTAIVDTNVARILCRIFIGKETKKNSKINKHLWELSKTLLPQKHVFDFNQALMDLGALLCVARTPKCHECPMRGICKSFPFVTKK